MTYQKRILITGGAGFIGSHAVRFFVNTYPEYLVINFDALTYAGNLENLRDIESAPNYIFVHGDITDGAVIKQTFLDYQVSDVLHFAAESHVDRSITDPLGFIKTNVLGTVNLLLEAKSLWKDAYQEHVFYHVSTDEVYGSLGSSGLFKETTPYDPQSPYSASKASSDHFVRAFANTYGLTIKISNCSNNYGPYQFPEKLLPLMINNIRHGKPLPVYGDGRQVRDWLYVVDHVAAIDRIFHGGQPGETYNIGGECEMENIVLVRLLCDLIDQREGKEPGFSQRLITYVKDRPGHDRRYAIDCSKIKSELGWTPATGIEEGLRRTIEWYFTHQEWLDHVTSGAYRTYYQKQYS